MTIPTLLYAQQSELDKLAEELRNQVSQQEGRYFVGEELIYSLQVQRIKLGEIDALVMQGGIGFELETYFATLDFPIYFDPSQQAYSGWFIRESNEFYVSVKRDDLNSPSLKVTAGDRVVNVPNTDYVYQGGRLFILETQFENIFGIKHTLDNNKLTALVDSPQKLPFLERLSRQKGAIVSGQNNEPSFVNLPRGYEIISPLILDIQANGIYRENTEELRGSYSVQGVRDLAMWRTSFSLAGNDDNKLNSVRLNFGRDSATGNLFGQNDITQFEFGDVRDVKQATGSSLNESLGFRVSNAPVNTTLENNVIQLDGDVPVGWDVELYRNNVLLRQEFNVETGRYNFLDVPLVFGTNQFEVVLYGPQGQVRRRTTSRIVDESVISDKKFKYDFSFTDTSRSLINSEIDKFRLNSGYNLSGRINYLIADATNLDIGIRSQFSGDNDVTVANLGVNTVLYDNVLLGTSIEATSKDEVSLVTNARTLIGEQALTFGARLNNISKKNGDSTSLITLGLDGNIGFTDSFKLPLNQQFTYQDNKLSETFLYSNRIGLNLGRLSIFNSLNFESNKVKGASSEDTLFGNLSAQINLGSVFFRTGAVYTDEGEDKLIAANASIAWNIMKGLRSNLSYQKDFLTDNSQASLYVSYLADNYSLSSTVGYSDLQGFNFGLNASFSIAGQDSRLNNISNSALAQTGTGSLAVRVFLDKNLNAIFDTGDVPISGAEVKALQFYKNATTDKDGVALLSRLPDFKSSDIIVNRNSLPDSFWMPRVEGVSITTRAGLVDFLDYPVVPVSEITGIIDVIQGESLSVGARIRLNLIDASGKVVDSTASEFDGFYSFQDVIPGSYTIQLDEASAYRFDLKPFSASITTDLIPEVIDRNFKLQKYEFESLYVSELANTKNRRMSALFVTVLENKLKDQNIQLYMYKLPKSGQQIFYTAASKDEQEIRQECDSLSFIDITCRVTPIDVMQKEQ